ncbi:MAG: tRNA epoxyqueuosine(34) reductase QueG [Hyphomicrobiales bacterium]|nr:MAG: tRNA epoxyqueuosine(34) reductase QueG [Hyphomicrobiales bacterium]
MSPTPATPAKDLAALKERLREKARAYGFDLCRVTSAEAIPKAGDALDAFVAAGHHGSMEWMATTADRRRAPQALWPQARSVIVLAMNYGPEEDPRALLDEPSLGAISVYARHRDYHDIIKGRLKQIAGWLVSELSCDLKVFVDTAPVMEKPLAAAAGMGWQGKHTNLVSREFGSWLFLSEIFLDVELPADEAETDHCGQCRACLDACPTAAFPAPYRLDARRCISYLTIELKGPIPRDLRPLIGNRIYGCDDCLAACPWNKFAQAAREAKLIARDDLKRPALVDLAALDDAAFRAHFSGSPVKRIGRDRFLRNVLIALGNAAGSAEAATCLAAALPHLDDDNALVRGAAIWAVSRLADETQFRHLADARADRETDPDAKDEWAAGLAGLADE